MPRTTSRPIVLPIVVDSAPTTLAPATLATVEATLFLGRSGGGSAGAGATGASVRAIREASISRALFRSTAWPYSASKGDWRMSAWSSSGVSGPMREEGGMRRVATTGVGWPRVFSTVTTASPMPSEVSVSYRS
jgi:hypothetical protein